MNKLQTFLLGTVFGVIYKDHLGYVWTENHDIIGVNIDPPVEPNLIYINCKDLKKIEDHKDF